MALNAAASAQHRPALSRLVQRRRLMSAERDDSYHARATRSRVAVGRPTPSTRALALARQTGRRLAEIGFLLVLFAGVWLTAAQIPLFKLPISSSLHARLRRTKQA
jgi:ribosomal protein S14